MLPVVVVTIGVFCVVVLDGLVAGMISNMIDKTACFRSGHLKVITRAYSLNDEQKPIDMAMLEVDQIMEELTSLFPQVDWNPRIYFGGVLDIPDAHGETRAQGPIAATAFDLLSPESQESKRIGLEHAVTAGNLIQKRGEVLISFDFAERFGVQPGDSLTFFGATMYGSLSFANFAIAGVVRFGIAALDRGAIVLDLADARDLLDMDNAAGEILGFLPNGVYHGERAESIKNEYNELYINDSDEYAPTMIELADQNSMAGTIVYYNFISLMMLVLLVIALSIVLWNTGVLGGIRRYNEFGVRLAMGELKGHIYGTLLTESLFIGLIGSVLGTALGLILSFYVSKYGVRYGGVMDTSSLLIDPVIRARITLRMYYIGFFPGVTSMLIGSALAGIAVYKRKTAELFKELG